jgi:ribosomal protein S21
MIKVKKRDGESGERLLKRFSGHVKGRRLQPKFRKLRYFSKKTSKRLVREAAISREHYRAIARKKQYIG